MNISVIIIYCFAMIAMILDTSNSSLDQEAVSTIRWRIERFTLEREAML